MAHKAKSTYHPAIYRKSLLTPVLIPTASKNTPTPNLRYCYASRELHLVKRVHSSAWGLGLLGSDQSFNSSRTERRAVRISDEEDKPGQSEQTKCGFRGFQLSPVLLLLGL